jgi:hypothetical protein
MNIEFTAVGRDNWGEFESFFERRGGPHYCWCMLWRPDVKSDAVSKKQQKKAAMKSRIKADEPVGVLAYIDGEAVAWCSVAPRESYRPLGGFEDLENVWSLVYPVKADSPSYKFMGTTTMFEQANFRFITMAGTRRHVMLLAL